MTAHGFRLRRTWTAALVLAVALGGTTGASAYADDAPSPAPSTQVDPAPSAPADGSTSAQAAALTFSVGTPVVDAKKKDLNGNGKTDPGDIVVYHFSVRNTSPSTLHLFIGFSRQPYRSGYCDNAYPTAGSTSTCYVQTTATAADLARGAVQPGTVTVAATGAASQTTTTPAAPPMVRDCSYNAPDTYTAPETSWFNYPYGSAASRNNIRSMVLRTINSTPRCQSIKLAAYSLNDNTTVDALIAAARRGVSVQVITDGHNVRGDKATQSPSFKRLAATIGSVITHDSWARVCSGSCRGTGGNHHDKLYLFSRAGSATNLTMAGSANLTIKAANGQWNHLDTYTSAATYSYYNNIFNQLKIDRPAAHQFVDQTTDAVRTWFFPKTGSNAATDPMMTQLASIGCTGSSYNGGRTIVRIGMYAWYEDRGLWLAKRVRALWNAGCDVAVEYAIMSNNVKAILYSPAGRGRIPMRQVATYYKDGTVANYDHQKYVTMIGRYGSNTSAAITWTGTTNFSNFGFSSDELTQVWSGATRAAIYRTAFANVWRGPNTRVPSPTSALPGTIGKGDLTLGAGKYRNLENN